MRSPVGPFCSSPGLSWKANVATASEGCFLGAGLKRLTFLLRKALCLKFYSNNGKGISAILVIRLLF